MNKFIYTVTADRYVVANGHYDHSCAEKPGRLTILCSRRRHSHMICWSASGTWDKCVRLVAHTIAHWDFSAREKFETSFHILIYPNSSLFKIKKIILI